MWFPATSSGNGMALPAIVAVPLFAPAPSIDRTTGLDALTAPLMETATGASTLGGIRSGIMADGDEAPRIWGGTETTVAVGKTGVLPVAVGEGGVAAPAVGTAGVPAVAAGRVGVPPPSTSRSTALNVRSPGAPIPPVARTDPTVRPSPATMAAATEARLHDRLSLKAGSPSELARPRTLMVAAGETVSTKFSSWACWPGSKSSQLTWKRKRAPVGSSDTS